MRGTVILPHGVRLHPGECVTVKLWSLKVTRIQGDLYDSCTSRGGLDEGESSGLKWKQGSFITGWPQSDAPFD